MREFKDRGSIDAFSESYKVTQLSPLDDRFYKIGENLSALRIAKIRSSPALFSGRDLDSGIRKTRAVRTQDETV